MAVGLPRVLLTHHTAQHGSGAYTLTRRMAATVYLCAHVELCLRFRISWSGAVLQACKYSSQLPPPAPMWHRLQAVTSRLRQRRQCQNADVVIAGHGDTHTHSHIHMHSTKLSALFASPSHNNSPILLQFEPTTYSGVHCSNIITQGYIP